MPRIQVDSDQLSSLAGRLLQVRQALENAHDDVSAYADATGSAELASSLGNFGQAWREGRAQITDGIASCHADLMSAAQAYSHEEQTLARGLNLRPGGTGGQG